ARYTAEIAVRGQVAYTTTWGFRSAVGNKVNVWDVSGNTPALIDSVIVSGATTLGDVAVSDDGSLLVVATERSGGSIVIFDLADPRHPRLLSRFTNADTDPGVHTAEIGRVNGKLYGFLSIDPIGGAILARLVIVDLSNPTAPREVFTKVTGNPFVHDTFVRDGLLFVALWDDGMEIWDIGGCGNGASPEAPRVLGGVRTINGEVHNIWWYHDQNGSKRFAFVGEEGPGSIGSSSRGDIHVVDISDPTAPKEVAFYRVPGAGTHNFSVDETNGVLYAAYYNGGVRAIDVRGDLGTCPASQQVVDGSTNLVRCDLRLMGRELGIGLVDLNRGIYVWGVQYVNGTVYASDMLNGIWKLSAVK
ncbi:MAG: LVIVD repeat-containing protein, partial [Gemmatimonas sp.]